MGDVLTAIIATAGISVGLDYLDTEKYLAGPPVLEFTVDKDFNGDNAFCNASNGLIAKLGVEQPLIKHRSVEFFAHYTHRSCLFEEYDKGSMDVIGIGIRVPLKFL